MLSKHRSLSKEVTWEKLLLLYSSLLALWTFYRIFFQTSVWIEEVVIKGILFTLPLFIIPIKEKNPFKALGITSVNFFQSVYLGISLGLILGLVGQAGNFIRHQTLLFSNFTVTSANIGAFLILSLITAFWEQLLFSGYFVRQCDRLTQNEIVIVSVSGFLFTLIHLPVLIFIQHIGLSQLILSAGLLFTLGTSCAILSLRLNNLIAPIMAHALWGVTIFLFR